MPHIHLLSDERNAERLLALEAPRCRTRCDFEAFDAHQHIENLLGDTVGEIFLVAAGRKIGEWQHGNREIVHWGLRRLGENSRLFNFNTAFRYEPVDNQPTDCNDQQDDDHRVYLFAGFRCLRLGPIDIDLSPQSFRRHLVHPREDQRGKEAEYQQHVQR